MKHCVGDGSGASPQDGESREAPAAPGRRFAALPAGLRKHCIAMHLRGLHPHVIRAALQRSHGLMLAPEALEDGLAAAMAAVQAWRGRPLGEHAAILFLERLWARGRGVPVWAAMTLARDGTREILGLWPERAGAGFGADMARELKRRGLRRVALAVPEEARLAAALRGAWPDARVVVSPPRALAPLLQALPAGQARALGAALNTAAAAELPPPAVALLQLAARHGGADALPPEAAAALQAFLDLPQALRAFLLRARVMTSLREKLQRNATRLPPAMGNEARLLLLAHQLQGMEAGWTIGRGSWRTLRDALAALERAPLSRKRLQAQAVGHAHQLHQ